MYAIAKLPRRRPGVNPSRLSVVIPFKAAPQLARNPAERRFLEQRLSTCGRS